MSITESTIETLLSGWAAAINDREPAKVAALFTDNALFQGFDPAPVFGRQAVATYYTKQPVGLRAEYEVLSVTKLDDHAISAYARVTFSRPDDSVRVYLTVIAVDTASGWRLQHYHVSRIPA